MRRRLITLGAAALGVTLAGPTMAQTDHNGTSSGNSGIGQSGSGYNSQGQTGNNQSGNNQTGNNQSGNNQSGNNQSGNNQSGQSGSGHSSSGHHNQGAGSGYSGMQGDTLRGTLSTGDQAGMDEIYTYHTRSAHELSAQQNAFGSDAEHAAMAGRLMVDHLILASRARQAYLSSGTGSPMVSLHTPRTYATTEEWSRSVQDASRMHSERMSRHSQFYHPGLQTLGTESRGTHDRQVAYFRPSGTMETTTLITLTPGQAVAGSRQEFSENDMLLSFYRGQVMEARELRAQADAVRGANADLAGLFIRMAEDHERLANDAQSMMRTRNVTVPMLAENRPMLGDWKAIVRHQYHHHQDALTKNGQFYLRASDPAVRELLNRGMEGATEHLRLLDPHFERAEEQ